MNIDTLPFIGAVHRAPRRNGPPNLIVIHDGETNEGDTAAEGMAAFFASGHTIGSAHICVDNNSGVRCALDTERVNGAGGVNDSPDARGLHLEQAGRAAQTEADWQDAYSQAVIANAATVCRQWIGKFPNIAPRFLDAAALRRGERDAITTHRQVTAAGFAGNGGHSDPGPNYPISQLIALIGGADTQGSIEMLIRATDDTNGAVLLFNFDAGTLLWLSPDALTTWATLAKLSGHDATIHPGTKKQYAGFHFLGTRPPGW